MTTFADMMARIAHPDGVTTKASNEWLSFYASNVPRALAQWWAELAKKTTIRELDDISYFHHRMTSVVHGFVDGLMLATLPPNAIRHKFVAKINAMIAERVEEMYETEFDAQQGAELFRTLLLMSETERYAATPTFVVVCGDETAAFSSLNNAKQSITHMVGSMKWALDWLEVEEPRRTIARVDGEPYATISHTYLHPTPVTNL